MPYFGKNSLKNLVTCDIRLQRLFKKVVKTYDCSVICGHRTKEKQNAAFENDKSKLRYPESLHNRYPSKAIDVVPYPVNWNDYGSFYIFAGYVIRVAEELNIPIRFGGDWDSDKKTEDQKFNDLPHFELID